MPLEAIEPRRLYRQVADQLRGYIDAHALTPGARLPTERDLAEKLNVSRPTIREALIALEVEGRIRIRVGSGIYVAEPSVTPVEAIAEVDGPFDIIRARIVFEGAVAAEAALRVEPVHLAEIDATIHAMENGRHPSDETIAIDRAFHVGIAMMLGNPVIARFVGDLFDQRMTPYFGRLAAHFEDAASWRTAIEEHRSIRDALASRNPAAARAALTRHLELSQDRFSRGFGESEATFEADDTAHTSVRRAGVRVL